MRSHKAPPTLNMDKKQQRIHALKKQFRKQLPKVEQSHIEGAKKLLEQHKKFEESKDRSIKNEMRGLAKDVGNYVYNATHGVGQLFNGYGNGKVRQLICHFCGEHCSDKWTNAKDGKWYGNDHVQFAGLSDEQQEKERACLSSKVAKI